MSDEISFPIPRPVELAAPAGVEPHRSRIHVAMLGRYSDPRWGDFAITREQVESWKWLLSDHFNGRVPIDEDHKTDKGVSSEASGWIVGLTVEGDAVLADVEWTAKGEQAVREKRFLYISPTFVADLKDQRGKSLGAALLRAALTNSPFLTHMPAVQLSAEEVRTMTTQPIHPRLVSSADQQYARERQELNDRATQLAASQGISYPAALLMVAEHSPASSRPEPPSDPLWADIVDDHTRLDSLVRTLSAERRDTYVETLSFLLEQAESSFRGGSTLTLGEVLRNSGVTAQRALTLMADDEMAFQLAAEKNPRPEVDDEGHALLRPGEDPDELLADPVAPKRAYRKARELGVLERYGDSQVGEVVGEGSGFEDFEREWRLAVDAGWDLVATLQLEDQGQNDALAALDRAQEIDAKVRQERKQKEAAERKQLEETAEKLRQKYRDIDLVNT